MTLEKGNGEKEGGTEKMREGSVSYDDRDIYREGWGGASFHLRFIGEEGRNGGRHFNLRWWRRSTPALTRGRDTYTRNTRGHRLPSHQHDGDKDRVPSISGDRHRRPVAQSPLAVTPRDVPSGGAVAGRVGSHRGWRPIVDPW